MAGELVIWRDGVTIGSLSERRGRLSFRYEPGASAISLSMPTRNRGYGDQITRPWFRGLLPEGQPRLTIAYDLGVAPDDDLGMLRQLGRDCAGALSLRSPGDKPADTESAGPLLDDASIGRLLRSLPVSPMGVDEGFRVSLPGHQHKLVLTRTNDGWCRPDGAPSTHILKPAIVNLGESTVANEAYCQWLARAAGLPAATTTILEFDGVPVLCSERFDRARHSDGSLHRIHQEDACQALSIYPNDKYQTPAGVLSLRAAARILAGSGGDIGGLLQQAVFAVVIGNADWHGKNVSFTLNDGAVSLAPIYDAMSTRFYETTATGQPVVRTLGMYVDNVTDIDDVRREHLINEGRSWGITTRRASSIVDDTVDALGEALSSTDAPVGELRSFIDHRLGVVASL